MWLDKQEKTKQRHWRLAQTTPMSVYSWPQINLPGENNPPLYHLSVAPAYERSGMPTSGDNRQPIEEKCTFFFFFSCMETEDKKAVPQHAGCYQCISWCWISLSLSLEHFDISRPVKVSRHKSNTGRSVRSLSSLSVLDRHHNHSCKNCPPRFQFISWASVNEMSTVFHPATFRHLHRPKGQQATWCNRSWYWTHYDGVEGRRLMITGPFVFGNCIRQSVRGKQRCVLMDSSS